MTDYVELPYNKKLNLLREHDISGGWPNLEHEKWCLHCGKSFNGHSVRVWKDGQEQLWLECGTPGCDGSPIDWADYPWWDEKHPQTRKTREKRRGGKRKRKDGSTRSDEGDIPF